MIEILTTILKPITEKLIDYGFSKPKNEFRVLEPEYEITENEQEFLWGDNAPSDWKIFLINEVRDNQCWLHDGTSTADPFGKWMASTKFSPNSVGIMRRIYALAVTPQTVHIVRQLFEDKKFKLINDVKRDLRKKHVNFKLSQGKKLIYQPKTNPDERARQVFPDKIIDLVTAAYSQVLERQPDLGGLQDKGKRMMKKELTVRGLVQELGTSDEYGSRFVFPERPAEEIPEFDKVRLMYKHFLARLPGDNEKAVINDKVTRMAKDGWRAIVKEIVGSDEYSRNFRDDTVPHKNLFDKN